MPRARIHRASDPEAMVEPATARILELLRRAIAERGEASLALSGGSTPGPILRRLARAGADEPALWSKLRVFWADERALPPGHEDSNYRLAQQSLLAHVPLAEDRVERFRGESPDLDAEARRYEARLRLHLGEPPRLDLVLLGLGADAHTASLFPGSPALAERERLAVAAPGPPPYVRRLTLTLPALSAARHVLFLVAGGDKAEAVRRVLEGDEPIERAPARGVRPPEHPVEWHLDAAAASRLGSALGNAGSAR